MVTMHDSHQYNFITFDISIESVNNLLKKL